MDTNARIEQLIQEGLSASGEGRAEAALALFAQAGTLAPAWGIPHFLIGSEHASAGDMDAAEAAFANALVLEPSLTVARYQLGLLQFSSARSSVALLTWQPLLDLPRSDALPHFVQGFAELAQDRWSEALRHFHAGLACENLVPAIAVDIRMVIAGVERLRTGPPVQEAGADDGSASHFLLAGYAKGLH